MNLKRDFGGDFYQKSLDIIGQIPYNPYSYAGVVQW